jgi:hypothetical protein
MRINQPRLRFTVPTCSAGRLHHQLHQSPSGPARCVLSPTTRSSLPRVDERQQSMKNSEPTKIMMCGFPIPPSASSSSRPSNRGLLRVHPTHARGTQAHLAPSNPRPTTMQPLGLARAETATSAPSPAISRKRGLAGPAVSSHHADPSAPYDQSWLLVWQRAALSG